MPARDPATGRYTRSGGGGGGSLGTAEGSIVITYNGAGVGQAKKDLGDLGKTAKDSSRDVGKAGTQVGVAGGIIAGGFLLAVKQAANFEKGLSNIKAVSGATTAEMESVRAKALQLGKDTKFSASEGAAAIEELVKAGISVADALGGAADATVALAAAGDIALPEAATIASNAMNQFGLSAKELPKVADAIAGAANASAIDIGQFGYSLSQVGAVAKLAGANFGDTATAIALLGNAGIVGSDAGTSLKSFLSNLNDANATDKQIAAFKKLGIVTKDGTNRFYDAAGSLKSLSEVSGILNESLKGQTAQQKQATLELLFGSDAVRAAAVLTEKGAKGFDDMATAMGKVTAADVAATKMDNLNGAIEQLQGSLETIMIVVGTPFLKFLADVANYVNKVISVFLDLPKPLQDSIGLFVGVLGAVLLLAAGALKLRAAFIALRAGALLFTGPIILIAVLIAAAVAAFVYFYKTSDTFRAKVNAMAKAVKKFTQDAIAYLTPKVQELGRWLAKVWQDAQPYLKKFVDFLQSSFDRVLPYLQKAIDFVVRFKKQFAIAAGVLAILFAPTIIGIGLLVGALILAYKHSDRFRAIVQSVAKFLVELYGIFVDKVLPVIIKTAKGMGTALVGAFKKLWPEIQAMIPAIVDFVQSFIDLAKAVYKFVEPALDNVIGIVKTLARVLVSTILPLLVKVGGIFFKVFVGVIGSALQAALTVIRGAFGIISGILKVITGLLTGDFSKAWEGVKQIFRGAVTVIFGILRGAGGVLKSIISGLGQLMLAGIQAIPGLLLGAGSLFKDAGKGLMDLFIQGIKSAASFIGGVAQSIANQVIDIINGAIHQLNSFLEFTIKVPVGPDVHIDPPDIPDIPRLAKGALVKNRPGGVLAVVGEGREDEVVSPLSQLWAAMDQVYRQGQTDLSRAQAAAGGVPSQRSSSPESGSSRLVSGSLSIDASGRAWIKGVAQDVYDGEEAYAGTYGRMG